MGDPSPIKILSKINTKNYIIFNQYFIKNYFQIIIIIMMFRKKHFQKYLDKLHVLKYNFLRMKNKKGGLHEPENRMIQAGGTQ